MTNRKDGTNATNEQGAGTGRPLRARAIAVAALIALTLGGGFAANSGVFSGSGAGAGGLGKTDGLAFRSDKQAGVQFTGQLDRGSVLHGSDGSVRMELILSADEVPSLALTRVPTDLVVVLDRSGSMGGKPLADAIASVRQLIARLGSEDRFALVSYSSDARLEIGMLDASEANRARWTGEVGRILAQGGTNMAAGVDLATQTVDRNRQSGRTSRVIVLSDGHANEGDHSLEGLRARAARAVAGEYVLSTVGVGLDFDEALMTALADSGTGNFYYVRDGSDLGNVFAGEFDSARETVAQAVTIELELAPGVELRDAAGYPIERDGRVARFRPGSLFAGQSRHVWLTLNAPTGKTGDFDLGEFRMVWRAPGSEGQIVQRFDRRPAVACVEAEADYFASLDQDVVVRSIAQDSLARLKQSVGIAMSQGRMAAAKDEIEEYKRSNRPLYDALGLQQEDMESFAAAEELEEQVRDASVGSPAARKAMSKTLSAEGQDGRRRGAKK